MPLHTFPGLWHTAPLQKPSESCPRKPQCPNGRNLFPGPFSNHKFVERAAGATRRRLPFLRVFHAILTAAEIRDKDASSGRRLCHEYWGNRSERSLSNRLNFL